MHLFVVAYHLLLAHHHLQFPLLLKQYLAANASSKVTVSASSPSNTKSPKSATKNSPGHKSPSVGSNLKVPTKTPPRPVSPKIDQARSPTAIPKVTETTYTYASFGQFDYNLEERSEKDTLVVTAPGTKSFLIRFSRSPFPNSGFLPLSKCLRKIMNMTRWDATNHCNNYRKFVFPPCSVFVWHI